MDSVGKKLGVTEDLSQWYHVEVAALRRYGSSGLLPGRYGSLYALLKGVYPEHDWLPWKFKFVSRTTKRNSEALQRTLRFVEETLSFSNPQEWYLVTESTLRSLGVYSLLIRIGKDLSKALTELLRLYRPEVSWDEAKFLGLVPTGQVPSSSKPKTTESLSPSPISRNFDLRQEADSRKYSSLSHYQASTLRKVFDSEAHPNRDHINTLASELKMDSTRVVIWFRNQRAKSNKTIK